MMTEDRSSTHEKFLTGLIGVPIAQSAARAMHGQAAEALGVRCHHQLIEVAGADAAGLRALLDGIRRLGFAGVNVTFPYKEAVIPLLDEMSPGAIAFAYVAVSDALDVPIGSVE
jgi:shikimate dehydrogenase